MKKWQSTLKNISGKSMEGNTTGKKAAAILIFAGAAVLLTAGILSGGVQEVWQKATMICMECIGIG